MGSCLGFLNCREMKRWFPRIIRMRDKKQHGRCPDCAEYTEFRKKAVDPETRLKINQKYRDHLRRQFADRTVYCRVTALNEAATSPANIGKVILSMPIVVANRLR